MSEIKVPKELEIELKNIYGPNINLNDIISWIFEREIKRWQLEQSIADALNS